MSRSVGLISELEVVNSTLSAVGDAPVQSLVDTEYNPVFIIRDMINNISRDMQTKGYWFNMEESVFLESNSNNDKIILPFNILRMEATSKSYVMRGLSVYDRVNRTDIIPNGITADITVMLPFEQLPQTAREYIRAACRIQYNNEFFGDQSSKRELLAAFEKAKQELEKENIENQKVNVFRAQAVRNIAFSNRGG